MARWSSFAFRHGFDLGSNFHDLRPLGTSASGLVLSAVDRRSGQRVAVKKLALRAAMSIKHALREVSGVVLTTVSSVFITSYKIFDDFRVDDYGLVPAFIILAVTGFMFSISIIGCCAILKQSKIDLGFFLLIILLIFAAEVTALVFGYVYKPSISEGLYDSAYDIFYMYDGYNSQSKAVDYLQTQLQCCGLNDYTDWKNFRWYYDHKTVPKSCCRANEPCSGTLEPPCMLNTGGCVNKLQKLLQDVLNFALVFILVTAIIKVQLCKFTAGSSSQYRRLRLLRLVRYWSLDSGTREPLLVSCRREQVSSSTGGT
ncbi:vertebrate transmembrane 4 superfamily-like [Silurus asotus]|uniref:Vertebrate transmembrane 4 superfamily-like n=1 Tax=Silurus asotus TaxID=30991 RepID=A0AAD5AED8_SILAS|nr:vertebrate transmembrane 4 superfamily-like [Silurus asotus]